LPHENDDDAQIGTYVTSIILLLKVLSFAVRKTQEIGAVANKCALGQKTC
jgi:hypothetical protein